jgi:hypothetical protein
MSPIQRTCAISGIDFVVSDDDQALMDRISPVIAGKKFALPIPSLSPDERQRRRLSFRNERNLYRTTCGITAKPVVSVYSPDKRLKVCSKESWLEQDNTEFGREFDFKRPFFDQFSELSSACWKAAVIQAGEMINSDYAHFCGWLKNCYLVFDAGKSEDCSYSIFTAYSRNCMEASYLASCELCYWGVKNENCYNTHFAAYCKNCSFSAYLHSCIGCKNCLFCTNLRNKEYYVYNQKVTPAQFTELWSQRVNGSHRQQEQNVTEFETLIENAPRKATNNLNCERCYGDELARSENLYRCFNCLESKDCRYCFDLFLKSNDCMDVGTFGEGMQYCYEVGGSGGALGKTEVSNLYFSDYIFYGGFNIFYSSHCHENCQNLFGCSDLRKKQYCILNKQYSREDYEALVPRIIEHMQRTGEWGEFFPMSMSPFGYNESLASEFYPEARERALAIGAHWSEYVIPTPAVRNTISAADLPDKISETPDDILDRAILCAHTARPFKLTTQELAFYREQQIAIPRLHPSERQRRRHRWLSERKLYERPCSTCGTQVTTSFAPERRERIVCDECFQKAVD